jgi:predicted acyltransferase
MKLNERLESLDVFRGITVAAMILVNNPGTWEHIYSPLRHAAWHGCTPTDLIFPFFLFIVGVSIHFSYKNKMKEGLTQKVLFKIVRRTLIIFGLGLFLSLFPKFDFAVVRIPGVLQRISVVFFFTSILYLTTSWLTQVRIAVLLLFIYYILMNFVPVPGFGAPNLEPGTNLGAWLDYSLLEGHLWIQSKTWDPEGILSTIPAIATGIIGMLTGKLFTEIKEPATRVSWLFFIGAILIVLGLSWGLIFPINKSLWTSSFVLYTTGIGMQFLAACHWLIDVQGVKAWSKPFTWYGKNAIFVFVVSGLLAKILGRIKVDDGAGGEISSWTWIYKNAFESWLSPINASLLFAITLVSLFGLILWWMYRKKIFIKI